MPSFLNDFGSVIKGATEAAKQIKTERANKDNQKFQTLMDMFGILQTSRNPQIAQEAGQASIELLMDSMGFKSQNKPGKLRKLAEQFVGEQADFSSAGGSLQKIGQMAQGGTSPQGEGVGRGNATTPVGGVQGPPQPPPQAQPQGEVPYPDLAQQQAPPAPPPAMGAPQGATPNVMGPPPPPVGLGVGPLSADEQLYNDTRRASAMGTIESGFQKDVATHGAGLQRETNRLNNQQGLDADIARIQAQADADPSSWKTTVQAGPDGLTATYKNIRTGETVTGPYSDPAIEAQRAVLLKTKKPAEVDKILAETITLENQLKHAQINQIIQNTSLMREQVLKLQDPTLDPQERVDLAENIVNTAIQSASNHPNFSRATEEERQAIIESLIPASIRPLVLSLLEATLEP